MTSSTPIMSGPVQQGGEQRPVGGGGDLLAVQLDAPGR